MSMNIENVDISSKNLAESDFRSIIKHEKKNIQTYGKSTFFHIFGCLKSVNT